METMMKSGALKTSFLILFTSLSISMAIGATIKVPQDYSTIQLGIDAAVNGDMVLVSPGTYVDNLNFNGKAIIVKSLFGPEVTLIDGNMNRSVVTFANSEGLDSVLDGFTISNGPGTWFSYAPGASKSVGGGIFCNNSSPTISNNIITSNLSEDGGGIYCYHSSPDILNNKVTGNQGQWGGGGIFCYKSTPTIKENNISENWGWMNGGGIYCYICSPIISDNAITNNHANFCGGIYCNESSPMISNNTITGNMAMFSAGGGVYCYEQSTPMITNNIIIGNIANHSGGGVAATYSTPIISHNNISGNIAGYFGGGIYCNSTTNLTILNNTITGNTGGDSGGGIYCEKASPTILNNTISGNSAKIGGGGICCFNSKATVVTNTIFWNNYAANGPEICLNDPTYNSTLSISYSNVKGGQSAVHVDPSCTLNWGAGMMDKDPLFFMGPKGFYYLSHKAAGQPFDSPCINAGSDLASNLGMDIYWTRTDESPDTGAVDMGVHYGPFIHPSLQVDACWFAENLGGSAKLLLLAESANANKKYLVFGSVTGTSPGITLPISNLNLPINWDIFTNYIIRFINQPSFQYFMGTLDSAGRSEAILSIPPVPGFAGTTMHFAFGLVDSSGTWDFASNAVKIEIVP